LISFGPKAQLPLIVDINDCDFLLIRRPLKSINKMLPLGQAAKPLLVIFLMLLRDQYVDIWRNQTAKYSQKNLSLDLNSQTNAKTDGIKYLDYSFILCFFLYCFIYRNFMSLKNQGPVLRNNFLSARTICHGGC